MVMMAFYRHSADVIVRAYLKQLAPGRVMPAFMMDLSLVDEARETGFLTIKGRTDGRP
jgi:hypothetical protein